MLWARGGAGPRVGRMLAVRLLGTELASAREPAVRRLGPGTAAEGGHAAAAAGSACRRPRGRVAGDRARAPAGTAGRPGLSRAARPGAAPGAAA